MCIEPVYRCKASKPFNLSAGELPGSDLGGFQGIVEGDFTGEVVDPLLVTGGLLCGGGKLAELSKQGFDFAEPALCDHLFDAGIDAAVEQGFVPLQADPDDGVAGSGLFPCGLERADGAAGQLEDFKGADEATGVVGVDALGGGGVDLLQAGVELVVGVLSEAVADGRVGAGAVEEAGEEGFVVHGGAAGGDQRGALCLRRGDGLVGEADEVGDGEGLIGGGYVDQVVGNFLLLGWGRLGGADVHTLIDLHGVYGEDLRAGVAGHLQCQGGFAAGGGADDGQDWQFVCHILPDCHNGMKLFGVAGD